ncbi:MAG: chemotaxis protein CheV [Gammaproteobacteria bacterium]|nr:chemotaxis protein CheV [Gammaproteobacteria bacterium]
MAGVLDRVDLRTRLAGRNRLELLMFKLAGRQRYGINVFKVREVIHCPPLTKLPDSMPVVRGVAHLRGNTMSIVDLNMALGGKPTENIEDSFVIVTEYNRSVQGFLVGGVDRIVNHEWKDIRQPPPGLGDENYLTAVTEVDGELVEVIDVEKVHAEVTGLVVEVSEELTRKIEKNDDIKPIFVVDDSAVARKQITRALDQAGLHYITAINGREALEMLQGWCEGGKAIDDQISMMISDIEMPEMDGYTLTKGVKDDPRLKGLYVLLHSSLSGVFNESMVKEVGADHFLPKFNADGLIEFVFGHVAKNQHTADAA